MIAEQIPWLQPEPFPLRTSNLRPPGQLSRCFASETLLSEIAADLGVDPVELRLSYLSGDYRASDVLKTVAAKVQWQKRSSPAGVSTGAIANGRGVAMTRRSGANGIFDATGVRLREVPFTPKRVLAGMQKG